VSRIVATCPSPFQSVFLDIYYLQFKTISETGKARFTVLEDREQKHEEQDKEKEDEFNY
jgi:hypothetical protein